MLHSRKNKCPYTPSKHLINLFMMTIGSVICVIGLTMFINPNNLLAGGVWGLSSILNHFFSTIPMGIFIILLNIPLLIWGWNKLHLRFAIYTLYVILLQSILLLFSANILPVYTNDTLLACLIGGVLTGCGSGIIVRYHGSGGGSDIIGIIMKGKYDISIGTITLTVNSLIVLISATLFGLEPAMYTLVNLYISATVFNLILEGLNRKRNMMIVSDKGTQLAERLLFDVGRGVTVIKGEGGYSHREKTVLFCVVSRYELAGIKEIIRETDPQAFVCINQTYEIMGRFHRRDYKEPLFSAESHAEFTSAAENTDD